MKHKFFLLLSTLFVMEVTNYAAVTIANNSSTGTFLSSTGAALTAGGISIGYFTGAAPSDSAIKALSPSTAFAQLVAAGYVDLRNISGATQAGGFDWSFPTPIGGTLQNIPIGSLPAGTQLYILGFNAGSYISGTQGTPSTTSTSFSSATEWAFIRDNLTVSPSDLGVGLIRIDNAVGASEVIVGTDNGSNVNLAAVPEPSRAILGIMGLLGLFIRRRR